MTDERNRPSDQHMASTPGFDELQELAVFEVLGVLDPVDLARLRRGFDALPPIQQARLVALQEALALDPMLRDVELPPGSLRQFAIGRVKQAIESDAESPAPLAHIGPASPAGRGEAITTERIREIVHEVSRLQKPQPSPQLVWRAASFVLLGALCVSLYMNWHHRAVSEELAAAVSSATFDREVAAIARDLGGFDLSRARHVRFVAMVEGVNAEAGAFVDEASGRVAVFGVGFEPDSIVGIVLRDSDGVELESRKVRVAASCFGQVHAVELASVSGVRVEIVDSDGRILFRQA